MFTSGSLVQKGIVSAEAFVSMNWPLASINSYNQFLKGSFKTVARPTVESVNVWKSSIYLLESAGVGLKLSHLSKKSYISSIVFPYQKEACSCWFNTSVICWRRSGSDSIIYTKSCTIGVYLVPPLWLSDPSHDARRKAPSKKIKPVAMNLMVFKMIVFLLAVKCNFGCGSCWLNFTEIHFFEMVYSRFRIVFL